MKKSGLWLILLLFAMTQFLYAQNEGQLFTRRIVWRGGENAFRYAVEIQRSENGIYQNHLYKFTTALYIDVSLPPGEYRFRIIPHDILDRSGEGTQWFHFEILPRAVIAELPDTSAERPAEASPESSGEEFQIINVEDLQGMRTGEQGPGSGEQKTEKEEQVAESREQITESEEQAAESREPETEIAEQAEETVPESGRAYRFNTVGASVGTSFIDPLIILTVHGTFSPVRNFFIELGCDVGFISRYEDVESYYCLYPFANIGFFMPFGERGGFFVGAGGGYMAGKYSFEYGEADISVWAVNFTGGINLFNFLNISYTLRTDFGSINHKLSAGYTYRFR